MKKAEMVLDEIQTDGAKYFITPMPGSAISEQDTPQLLDVEIEGGVETQLEISAEIFPPLGSSGRKRYDGRIQGEGSGDGDPSFADAIRNTAVSCEPANPLSRRMIL